MRKRILSLIMVLTMLFSLVPDIATQVFATGDEQVLKIEESIESQNEQSNEEGSEEPEIINGFYQLKTKEDLFWFANKANELPTEEINAELLNDIDLENELWTPIKSFLGEFNGNGFYIRNININATAHTKGFIETNKGTVRNFKLTGSIQGNKINLGAVAGKNQGTISEVENYATVKNTATTTQGNYVGGIVGVNEGTIYRVSNYGSIEGYSLIGGIAGQAQGRISSAANFGIVKSRTGYADTAGGILGAIDKKNPSTIINNVYNQGTVRGGDNGKAGGIVGIIQNTAYTGEIKIINAYNTGELTANEKNPISPTGGNLKNTFYLADETDWSLGKVSVEDFKTTEIIDKLNIPDDVIIVDTDDEFVLTKDDYPTLRWQGLESEEEIIPELEDLKRAADILKVTVQSTPNELKSPVTDDKWIRLVDYDKGGDYSILISWESSDETLIEIDGDIGFITLPDEGEREVRLTATLSKGSYELKKHFDYILTKNKPAEDDDEKYLSDAIKSLEWFNLKLNSDKDNNVNVHMKDVLKAKGFEGIEVIVKSSDKQEFIDLDGNIDYMFDEEHLRYGLPGNRQVELNFEFSKGEAKKDYAVRTVIGWDRDRVRDAIRTNIIEPLSNNLIGSNESFDKIKESFEVPTSIQYTMLSWESSDSSVLKVVNSSIPLSPSTIKPIRSSEDKKVNLVCKIQFNHDFYETEDLILTQKYELTVSGDNVNDTIAEMQKLLDDNYTVDKLKDFTNKQAINPNDVRNDIQLIIPQDTGIDNYFDYKFEVSSDSDLLVVNSYRAYVYRPLPGEEAEEVNLTVHMKHKEKNIEVTKLIPIKITALSQKEIDDELHLMQLAKENYFKGIQGDNLSSDEITSNLRAFRELNLINGELVWTRHINDDRNTGICPDNIEGWENQEQWRLFKSSKPNIISHENLLVTKPEFNTDVKIESSLSSIVYGKYALKYPHIEDFQKLYKQDVSAVVTVIGEKGSGSGDPEENQISVGTAIVVFEEDGTYSVHKNVGMVSIDKDKHDGGFTAFGALQATTDEYQGSGSWITSIYGITGPQSGGWMFTVNGEIPSVSAGQAKLKEGDKVIWFCTYDWQRDEAPTWKELGGDEEEKLSIKIKFDKTSVNIGEELPLVAEVRKGDTVFTDKEILWLSSDAEIAVIEHGNLVAKKAGEVTVTAALIEDKNIKDSIKIKVKEEGKVDLSVEEAIKALRKYYSNKAEYTFRAAVGYNYTSDNIEKDLLEISYKFKTNENPKSASENVGNIIGLISAGKNPYNHKGKNYVEALVSAQNAEGKFIIGQYDDYPTTLAFSVLALDMANAQYDREKAIDALIKYQDAKGSFAGIDETGMVLTALAKYKDIAKVQDAIDKAVSYLKAEKDANTGGYIVYGGENPYSAAAVLQGLIAVGEDPLSEQWTKNGKTIVDSLMSFYEDGHFENKSEYGTDIDMITEQAFIALADVYMGKSMFNEIKLNDSEIVRIAIQKPDISKITEGEIIKLFVNGYDSNKSLVPTGKIEWSSSDDEIATVDEAGIVITKKPGEVIITAKLEGKSINHSVELTISEKEFETNYTGSTELSNENKLEAKIEVKNLTKEKKSVSLIVALYDKKSNKMISYEIERAELSSDEEKELAVGLLISVSGDYYIRIFLWDSLENQAIIMNDYTELKIAN